MNSNNTGTQALLISKKGINKLVSMMKVKISSRYVYV